MKSAGGDEDSKRVRSGGGDEDFQRGRSGDVNEEECDVPVEGDDDDDKKHDSANEEIKVRCAVVTELFKTI